MALVLLAAVAIAGRGQEPMGNATGLEANLIRSWAGNGVTQIDGLVHVPLDMLAGSTTRAYRFEVFVNDSAGTELFRDSWVRTLSERATAYVGAEQSYMLESFGFGLLPGAYEIGILAYPTDAADLGFRETVAVTAFADRPVASDLMLSNRIMPLADTDGGSWSVERGGFGISAAARTVILDAEPELFYYIELYGGDSIAAASVEAEIRNDLDQSLFETPSTVVEIPVGGKPFTGRLPLTGLPAGEYDLVMRIGLGDAGERLVRAASFELREADVPVRSAGSEGSGLAEYFDSLSDRELEQTFGGVGVLLTDAERKAFETLPPDAKRRYLVDFFDARDPNPAIPGNPFLDEYLDRVATIRTRYEERIGTSARLPWMTDMGSTYLRLGEPYDRIVNYNPTDQGDPNSLIGGGGFGGEAPYEIWQYRDTGFVYLFVQENRFDAWSLIYSTDPRIPPRAGWQTRIGESAARDLRTNYGIVPHL
ncbi:MAG: GWxTD domain-containing protein [Gemmatimonadota bacterium]